jgi:hypothetical protein
VAWKWEREGFSEPLYHIYRWVFMPEQATAPFGSLLRARRCEQVWADRPLLVRPCGAFLGVLTAEGRRLLHNLHVVELDYRVELLIGADGCCLAFMSWSATATRDSLQEYTDACGGGWAWVQSSHWDYAHSLCSGKSGPGRWAANSRYLEGEHILGPGMGTFSRGTHTNN